MAASNKFVVVVPAYRSQLTDDERLSLRHLEHFLPRADKFLVMPETLDFGRDGYLEARFAPGFFDGIDGCNRLRLSRDFYARFEQYEFMLIHELDAIVLRPDIDHFLESEADYLGAPWIDYSEDGQPSLARVGNGGFSLRRVSAFLKLLDSPAPKMSPREYYRRRYSVGGRRRRLVGLYKAALTELGMRHSIHSSIARHIQQGGGVDFVAESYDLTTGGYEDDFIATEAALFSPSFAVGSVEQALAFAFEKEPRFCYEKSGGRLPLGAHAWAKWDRAFWEPYLLSGA